MAVLLSAEFTANFTHAALDVKYIVYALKSMRMHMHSHAIPLCSLLLPSPSFFLQEITTPDVLHVRFSFQKCSDTR
jgi:hypothetical protein